MHTSSIVTYPSVAIPFAQASVLVNDMESDDDLRDFRHRVSYLARPACVYSPEDLTDSQSLYAAFSASLSHRWRNIVDAAEASGDPLLYVYASDGWGRTISDTTTIKHADGVLFRRGRARSEFLLEREILKSRDVSGATSSTMMIHSPRPMLDGKNGWNILGAACERRNMMRMSAPSCIILNFFVQDGLHCNSLARRQAARHEEYYDVDMFDGGGDGDSLLREKDLVLSWRCILHIFSSGIQWMMKAWGDADLLSDLHVSIKSLSNSTLALIQVVPEFIDRFVHYELADDDLAVAESVWRVLGAKKSFLPTILKVNPRFDHDRRVLQVSARLADDPDAKGLVRSVMLYFIQFYDFSETRWAGCGPSTRKLISFLAVGGRELMSMAFARRDCNTEKLGGVRRLGRPVLYYSLIAAVACWPIENGTVLLLEDDRFFKHAETIKAEMHAQYRIIQELSIDVWRVLAAVLPGCEASQLAHDCLRSVPTGLAYLHYEAFRHLSTYPYKLTQGNVQDKVRELSVLPRADEDRAVQKLQILLGCGVPQASIVNTMLLLQDAPCSVGVLDKAHGLGSLLMKAHTQYNARQLAIRSMICQCAPLCTLAEDEKKLRRLRGDLQSLERRTVRHSARNEYCSQLALSAAEGIAAGSADASAARGLAIAVHSRKFDELGMAEQLVCAMDAERAKQRKLEALDAKKALLKSQISDILQATDEANQTLQFDGVVNSTKANRFTSGELHRVATLYYAGASGIEAVTTSPKATSEDVIDVLEQRAARLNGPWTPYGASSLFIDQTLSAMRAVSIGTMRGSHPL